MRWLIAIGGVLLAIGAAFLIVLNPEPMTVRLTPARSATASSAAVVLTAFGAGAALIGILWSVRAGTRGWREVGQRRRARREAGRAAAARRARDLVWTGRYAQARAELLRGESGTPADVARLQLLAETHLHEGDTQAARTLLTEGLARFGPEPHLLDLLAQAAARVEDRAGAIEALERARQAAPDSPRLARRLRDGYIASGRWEQALALQGELVLQIRDPTTLAAEEQVLRGLRYETCAGEADARRAARRYVALTREDPNFLPAWVAAGDQYLRAGKRVAARRIWERGARRRPALVLLERIAGLDAAAGRPERTERSYQRLARRHPESGLVALALARRLIETGRFEPAAAVLEVLPDAEAGRSAVHSLWGQLYLRRGDPQLAAEAFARALGPELGLGGPYRCTACRETVASWTGRCPRCHAWNTMRNPTESA